MFKCRDEVNTLPPYELGGSFAEEMKKYGVTRVVKLNSNEGPYPPFPAAIKAMQKAAANSNRYPDPSSYAVRLALGEKYSVPAESIAIGPGSVMLIRALMEVSINAGDEVVIAWPSFPPYLLATHIMGYALTEGVQRAYVADLVPGNVRGSAMGTYNALTGISALPASIIGGVLWQMVSPSATFVYGAVFAVLAAVALLLVPIRPLHG